MNVCVEQSGRQKGDAAEPTAPELQGGLHWDGGPGVHQPILLQRLTLQGTVPQRRRGGRDQVCLCCVCFCVCVCVWYLCKLLT